MVARQQSYLVSLFIFLNANGTHVVLISYRKQYMKIKVLLLQRSSVSLLVTKTTSKDWCGPPKQNTTKSQELEKSIIQEVKNSRSQEFQRLRSQEIKKSRIQEFKKSRNQEVMKSTSRELKKIWSQKLHESEVKVLNFKTFKYWSEASRLVTL